MHVISRFRRLPAMAIVTVGAAMLLQLGACQRTDAPIGDAAIVARVNADEITLGRLKAAIGRVSLSEVEQDQAKPDVAMDALVRQSLAAEQARKLGLDQLPAVRTAMEDAAREILANAYFNNLGAQAVKPTGEDIHAYYVAHRELFQVRRLYSFKEIALPDDLSMRVAIKEVMSRARGLDEIAHQLRRRGIEFQVTSSIRAPETLPLDMLPQLSGSRTGDLITHYGGGVAYVAQVIGMLNAPIAESAAHDRIAKYLENQRARQLLADEDKRLRSDARIEIDPDLQKLIDMPPGSGATVTLDGVSPTQNPTSTISASARIPTIQ